MPFRLLRRFESIFRQGPYLHRNAGLGDSVAIEWYEDMYELAISANFNQAVEKRALVVNTRNKITGRDTRRGDGTMGDLVPGVVAIQAEGFHLWRGPTATMRLGVEVKILAKSMIKQIDRVINDLNKQATEFESLSRAAPRIALVGVNWSDKYLSFEGERSFFSDRAPSSEAAEAKRRIQERVAGRFDELIFLEFKASNEPPYEFQWTNSSGIEELYAAAQFRVAQRFSQ